MENFLALSRKKIRAKSHPGAKRNLLTWVAFQRKGLLTGWAFLFELIPAEQIRLCDAANIRETESQLSSFAALPQGTNARLGHAVVQAWPVLAELAAEALFVPPGPPRQLDFVAGRRGVFAARTFAGAFAAAVFAAVE